MCKKLPEINQTIRTHTFKLKLIMLIYIGRKQIIIKIYSYVNKAHKNVS